MPFIRQSGKAAAIEACLNEMRRERFRLVAARLRERQDHLIGGAYFEEPTPAHEGGCSCFFLEAAAAVLGISAQELYSRYDGGVLDEDGIVAEIAGTLGVSEASLDLAIDAWDGMRLPRRRVFLERNVPFMARACSAVA